MNLPQAQFPSRPPKSSLYEDVLGLSLALRWLAVLGAAIWLYPLPGLGSPVVWVLGAVATYGLVFSFLHIFEKHPPLAITALLDVAALIIVALLLPVQMSVALPIFAAVTLVLGLAFGWLGIAFALIVYGVGEVVAWWAAGAGTIEITELAVRAGSMLVGGFVLGALIERHEALRARLARVALKERYLGVFDLQNFAKALEYLHKLAVRGKWHYSIMVLDIENQKLKVRGRSKKGEVDSTLFDLVGNEARAALRSTDLIGRVGEAMFAIALPETGLTGAEHVANRLQEKLKEFDPDIEVTVGLAGIAPTPMDTSEQCLHSAFTAMREAKSGSEAVA